MTHHCYFPAWMLQALLSLRPLAVDVPSLFAGPVFCLLAPVFSRRCGRPIAPCLGSVHVFLLAWALVPRSLLNTVQEYLPAVAVQKHATMLP